MHGASLESQVIKLSWELGWDGIGQVHVEAGLDLGTNRVHLGKGLDLPQLPTNLTHCHPCSWKLKLLEAIKIEWEMIQFII